MTTADELREQARRLLKKADELSTRLSEADVKAMWAQGRHAEIVQARAEGRLDDYLTSTTEGDD